MQRLYGSIDARRRGVSFAAIFQYKLLGLNRLRLLTAHVWYEECLCAALNLIASRSLI